MDQTRLKRPSSNLKWLWWGLGSFFALLIAFRAGSMSNGFDNQGMGKKVGIIQVSGPIISSNTIVKDLENYRNRKDISAILVRIDSPGGLVAPTQEIYEKIKAIKEEKPIIASMGSVAASGGYYIALGADSIIANQGTIVGSIGVIMNYPVMTELLDKVGIEFETVKSGELKDVGSYSRQVTEADRKHLNDMVNDMYGQFVNAVSENRSLTKEEVVKIADGRVYTGKQSKELGLIDVIGTFEDAVLIAGTMGQITGKPKTVQVNKKRPSVLDWFTGNLGQTVRGWFDELPAYRWRME